MSSNDPTLFVMSPDPCPDVSAKSLVEQLEDVRQRLNHLEQLALGWACANAGGAATANPQYPPE